jgi:formamidopyrimidine-DNA glycosylase
MPELPEVEFARTCLERWLVDEPLAKVEAETTRVIRGSEQAAIHALAGHRLKSIERRGKWLFGRFDRGLALLAHLGMTGKYVLQGPGDAAPTSSRVRFLRKDGAVVHYRDPRMFGRVSVGPTEQLEQDPGFRSLGPDAWDDPPTAKELQAMLQPRKRAVKEILMDQTVLAGVGNIQATEALFHAHVHPARAGTTIQPAESSAIRKGIHWTLARTLKMNKGDKIVYVEEGGGVENPFLIYGRTGEPCPRCGTTLKSSQIGGRTSAFCPHCQPRNGG